MIVYCVNTLYSSNCVHVNGYVLLGFGVVMLLSAIVVPYILKQAKEK